MSPLFKALNIMKLVDLITFHRALVMYKYHNQLLRVSFSNFFAPVIKLYNYNSRRA